MGGGTTDIGVFKRGNLAHSACVPLGGEHVTADLAQILKIPLEEAENVKRRFGSAIPELADQDLSLEITNAAGHTITVNAFDLSRIIKPRLAEIFSLIREEIEPSAWANGVGGPASYPHGRSFYFAGHYRLSA